ncbi:hypothetical protein [Paraburkholderia ultramafica]|uniref:hypothetical protein n=1 Tax=Paraburkholderia ultramafica TaxID=1544867 RepID=UPI0015840BE4|nr:hypothetical protein [Paraburkholderia ultramafica]
MGAAAETVMLRLPTSSARQLAPRAGGLVRAAGIRIGSAARACPSTFSRHGKPAAFGVLVSDRRVAGPGHVDFEYIADLPALSLELRPESIGQLKHAVAAAISGVHNLDYPTFWRYHRTSSIFYV